jgi:hypothetical protein
MMREVYEISCFLYIHGNVFDIYIHGNLFDIYIYIHVLQYNTNQ